MIHDKRPYVWKHLCSNDEPPCDPVCEDPWTAQTPFPTSDETFATFEEALTFANLSAAGATSQFSPGGLIPAPAENFRVYDHGSHHSLTPPIQGDCPATLHPAWARPCDRLLTRAEMADWLVSSTTNMKEY